MPPTLDPKPTKPLYLSKTTVFRSPATPKRGVGGSIVAHMRIAIGSDHAGYELKGALIEHLRSAGHQVTDHGTDSTDATDYAPICAAVARNVVDGGADRGIVLGGSGQGEQMAANKVDGARAALVCHVCTTMRTSCRWVREWSPHTWHLRSWISGWRRSSRAVAISEGWPRSPTWSERIAADPTRGRSIGTLGSRVTRLVERRDITPGNCGRDVHTRHLWIDRVANGESRRDPHDLPRGDRRDDRRALAATR